MLDLLVSVIKNYMTYIVNFTKSLQKKNPDGNIYDDYFAKLFEESYKDNPKYQRDGGDWINWNIPNTNYHYLFFNLVLEMELILYI